jgi:putative phosphoribosyl transferase
VLAVPVAPPGWTGRFRGVADELVAVDTPQPFHAVGQFYADFSQTTDEEVVECLRRAAARSPVDVPAAGPRQSVDPPAGERHLPPCEHDVTVAAGRVRLAGHLAVPERALGAVVFVHGSGSSRHSPRNRFVASLLGEAGLATLLFDLLTGDEEGDRANIFDIELLARRLVEVTAWLGDRPEVADLPIGYFGASTGAAAALWAAAEPDARIGAVVSRGGRPDLAAGRLGMVRAPTLLVVGGRDDLVLRLNRGARAELRCVNDLVVVPGATHLFEEPGTLRAAAEAARDWFTHHLARAPGRSSG